MLEWFAKHSDALTVSNNIGTLLIWLIYAHDADNLGHHTVSLGNPAAIRFGTDD